MYLGKLVELGRSEDVYNRPLHPYTKALFGAIPLPVVALERRELTVLEGNVPSPVNPPSGCRFRTRCPLAADTCKLTEPVFREITSGHFVACHFVE
jgi:oligopeptide transport system ATP-binding protein